jgi:hypothetical protein
LHYLFSILLFGMLHNAVVVYLKIEKQQGGRNTR